MNTMTKSEAIAAMERGEKVKHECFEASEYLIIKNGTLLDEYDQLVDRSTVTRIFASSLYPTGWSIYHPETGALVD